MKVQKEMYQLARRIGSAIMNRFSYIYQSDQNLWTKKLCICILRICTFLKVPMKPFFA